MKKKNIQHIKSETKHLGRGKLIKKNKVLVSVLTTSVFLTAAISATAETLPTEQFLSSTEKVGFLSPNVTNINSQVASVVDRNMLITDNPDNPKNAPTDPDTSYFTIRGYNNAAETEFYSISIPKGPRTNNVISTLKVIEWTRNNGVYQVKNEKILKPGEKVVYNEKEFGFRPSAKFYWFRSINASKTLKVMYDWQSKYITEILWDKNGYDPNKPTQDMGVIYPEEVKVTVRFEDNLGKQMLDESNQPMENEQYTLINGQGYEYNVDALPKIPGYTLKVPDNSSKIIGDETIKTVDVKFVYEFNKEEHKPLFEPTLENRKQVNGTGVPGDKVVLTDSKGIKLGEAIIDAKGKFRIDITRELIKGEVLTATPSTGSQVGAANTVTVQEDTYEKELEKVALETKTAITNDSSLTVEEKEMQIKKVEEALQAAKIELSKAVTEKELTEAVTTGSGKIKEEHKAGVSLENQKQQAIADVNKKLEEVSAAIDVDNTLTASEKASQKKVAEEEANNAIKIIKESTTVETLNEAKVLGIEKIETSHKDVMSLEKRKEEAIKEIEVAKATAISKIDEDNTLTTAEKTEQKEAVDAAAKAAEEEVNGLETADDIVKSVAASVEKIGEIPHSKGSFEEQKEAAEASLVKALEETISNIEKDSNLSDADKTAQKEKAETAYNDGIEAIGNATDADRLKKAVSDGESAIKNSYIEGTPLNEQKATAKANLSEVAKLTKEKIDADVNLSNAEKTAQKEAVDSALEEGNAAIDAATSGELLSQAITSGTKAIEGSYVKGIPLDEQKATTKENLQNIAKETKSNIDKDETLSADEKEKQKANVDQALEAGELAIGSANTPDELITEVATGTKNIKESHVTGSSLEDQKKEAGKALDDKATEVKNTIDSDSSLTAKEKVAQKAAVDKAAEDAKKVLVEATTPEAITKATEDGKTAIGKEHETGMPIDKQKEEAERVIIDVAEKEKAAIDSDPTLTVKEKAAQKANVDKAVEDAKTAIETAKTPEAIAKAKEDGETAIGEKHVPGESIDKQKEAAEQVISEAAEKEKAAIDSDPTLTDTAKETQKEAVDKAADDAKKVLEEAITPDAINDARDKGVEVIEGQHKSGESVDKQKAAAKEAIDAKATAVKESIAKDPTLTEAEKTAQQKLVDTEANKAKGLIDEATKASEINSTKDNGLAAIEDAHKPGQGLDARKESANKALEEEAKLIKERINADITLTEAEKQTQSNGVDKDLEDAKQAVSKAKDASSVDTAKGQGITAIDGNYQPGSSLEIRKEAAKASIDKEVEITKVKIAKDPTLTTEQKALQLNAVDEVAAKAKESIDEATNASSVDQAKGKGVETIANQHQPGDGLDARKESAKEALEKEAALIKERIAKDTTLTVEEKAQQSTGVDNSLTQAIGAVDNATDADGIDTAKGQGITAIDGNYQSGSSLVERKESAKVALEKEANKIKELIAKDPTLTADEKVAQSAAVDRALNNGLVAIDNAPDASGVDKAKGDGITNIDSAYQPGDGLNLRKDSAKEGLEKEAAKIREAIEFDSTLTGEEKAQQISGVNSSLEASIGAVDAAQNADNVDLAKGEGITAIDSNYKPGTPILDRKNNAKREIEKEAAQVKERINNDASLTEEEKIKQSAAVDTAAANAKTAIDSAIDANGVDSAKGQGITDINNGYETSAQTLEERKSAAKESINNAESDAINRITSDPTLTAEEKAIQVAGVSSAANDARGNVDGAADASSVDRVQGEGITAIDNNYQPGTPLDGRKDAAKAGIEEERLAIIDKINNDSTLTSEEKAIQIAGANAAADSALIAIDGATDASGVDIAKGQGITAIDNNYQPGSPLDSRKELAKEGIDEATAELKDRILNDVTLTDEEKAAQIAGAEEDAVKAKETIDTATDASGVDNAKGRGITEIDDNYQPGNPLDGRKELAKEGIDTAAKEAIDKIKNDPTLTAKEKETQIAGVNEDAAKAKAVIDAATNASGVDAAKGDGIEEVDNNYQPGNPLEGRKEDAKNDIDRFTEEAIDRITNDPTLTKEEKEKQITGAKEDAAKAKEAIDAATDASGVDAAKGEGVKEIDGNHQSGNPLDSRKELAKEAIDKAATDAKDKIANDPTLTKEEKAKQSEAVDASKEKAKATIDAATDASGVDNAKGQGITAIDGNYQPGNPLTDRKEAAKKDIDKEANATKEKINNDKTLTALEKETQIQEVDAEATKAKEAIDAATDASGVDNSKGQGITEINKKYQTGSGLETRKESAKADIDAAAKATKDKIANDPSLTAAEKTEQSKSVDAAAKKAKAAIDAATNADGVDVAKGQGITNIDQAYQPGAPVEGVKETAKNEIDAAAEATKDKIKNDATLTAAEKAEQSKSVDAAAKKAKEAIDVAKDVDAIKETRDKGVSSVNEQHETGTSLDSQKEAANKAIDEAAAKAKADIEKDASLSKEEKAKQTAAVDAEVKASKEAISEAESADLINAARDKGVSSINEQHKAGTPLDSQKEAAKKELEAIAEATKEKINNDAKLTAKEKATQIKAVEEALKAAEKAINKAEDADAINKAKKEAVTTIEAQYKPGKKTTGGTGNNGGGSYTGGKGGTYTGGSNTSGTTGKGGSLPKTGSEVTSGLFAGIVGLGLSGLAFLGFRRKEDEVEK